MPNRESNPSNQELDELAARIRAALEAARQARSNALDHALQAGDALNAAQERVSSGWKRWLRTNCFLSPSTAMLYQQLARHRPEIEAKIEQIGELSLRSARRLVANPGGRKKKKSKPARQRLIAAWNQATDEERTAFLGSITLDELLRLMPPDWRPQLEVRAGGQIISRVKDQHPNLRLKNLKHQHLRIVHDAESPTPH